MPRHLRQMLLLPLLALLAIAALGCDNAQAPQDREGPLTIVVSIQPHAWLVTQIANPDATVLTLVQPGDGPHTYQPSDRQITDLVQAHVYFQTGVPFENGPWLGAVKQSRSGPRIVDLRQGIKLRDIEAHSHHDEGHDHHDHGHDDHDHHGHHGHEHHDDHGHDDHGHDAHADGKDPHIWLAPELLKRQARTITETLAELDPDSAETYRMRLTELDDKLDALDREIRETLTNSAKRFYVFHPAWGYFADAYGLTQIAIEIEGKEPSDAELTQLQQQAREEGVKVIFVQPQITGKSATILADQIGARVERLDPLGEDVIANLRAVANAMAAAGKNAQ